MSSAGPEKQPCLTIVPGVCRGFFNGNLSNLTYESREPREVPSLSRLSLHTIFPETLD